MNYLDFNKLDPKSKFHIEYHNYGNEISNIRSYGMDYESDQLFEKIESKSLKAKSLKLKRFDFFIIEYAYRNYLFHPNFGESVVSKVEHLNYIVELDIKGFWDLTLFYYENAVSRLFRDYPNKHVTDGSELLEEFNAYYTMLSAFSIAFKYGDMKNVAPDHVLFKASDLDQADNKLFDKKRFLQLAKNNSKYTFTTITEDIKDSDIVWHKISTGCYHGMIGNYKIEKDEREKIKYEFSFNKDKAIRIKQFKDIQSLVRFLNSDNFIQP